MTDAEGRLLQGPARWQPGDLVPAPLDFYRCAVRPEWVDYNHHMTEAAYLTAFGWASDALFTYIGDDDAYRSAGHSFYTVETHIDYRREAKEGEPLRITTHVLGVANKRLHIVHAMFRVADDVELATTEQMLVHVDTHAGSSTPIPPAVRAALDAIVAAHRTLARRTAGCMHLE
jgi:acyl-CoA thioesterase FadM